MWLRMMWHRNTSWFKCFVAGRNFSGVLVGDSNPVGFYTTCFVRARSKELAEVAAIGLVRADKRLELPSGCLPLPNESIIVEEIIEVNTDAVPRHAEGFVWYEMETN